MLLLLSLLALFAAVILITGASLSTPKYRGDKSGHFDGQRFRNSGGAAAKGLVDVLKWMTHRRRGPWTRIESVFGKKPSFRVEGSQMAITFVNHSTLLIQTGGLNILTDPLWSQRASPFSWAGPKRMRPPGIRFEDLPPIDVVLISHNHYDHLDVTTMRLLVAQHHPRIFTPLGMKAFMDKKGFTAVVDMDWWEHRIISDQLTLHAVPAQHFSGRGLFDRDASLWCGYMLQFGNQYIYYAGDTGYGPFVQEISKKFQPVALAFLPIGAYLPTWFMSPIHTSPEDAVQMHLDLQAGQSIGIHYGTFPLADDGMEQPKLELARELDARQVPSHEFRALPEGEVFHFDRDPG